MTDLDIGQLRDRTPESRSRAPLPSTARVEGGPGRILAVEAVSQWLRILRVGRPPGLAFRAGQYVRIGADGGARASATRKFSIASAPHEPFLDFCIELHQGGAVSPRLFALTPGARLSVATHAKGGFELDESAKTHVFVATGAGIAPLRSMLRDALHRGIGDRLIVAHGASFAGALPWRDELCALDAADARVMYLPTVSRPDEPVNAAWTGRTGRVDAVARELAGTIPHSRTHVYACGHPGMVTGVVRSLRDRGFAVSSETFS